MTSKGAVLDFLSFGLKRRAALKRMIIGKAFLGALERSFPRMNAGAPSERQSGCCAKCRAPSVGQSSAGGTSFLNLD